MLSATLAGVCCYDVATLQGLLFLQVLLLKGVQGDLQTSDNWAD